MTGIELIAEERQRQIEKEGFDAKHDQENDFKDMVKAALFYAEASMFALDFGDSPKVIEKMKEYLCFRNHFPFNWDKKWCKPSNDPIRNLEKAGALIAACIDKLKENNYESV